MPRKPLWTFTFEREAWWIVIIALLFPLVGILLSIVIPAFRRWVL